MFMNSYQFDKTGAVFTRFGELEGIRNALDRVEFKNVISYPHDLSDFIIQSQL